MVPKRSGAYVPFLSSHAMLPILQTHSKLFLVMEYCAGGDLSQFLRQNKAVSEATARSLLRQLAAGLREMWTRSLVHVRLRKCRGEDGWFWGILTTWCVRQLAEDSWMGRTTGFIKSLVSWYVGRLYPSPSHTHNLPPRHAAGSEASESHTLQGGPRG